MTGDASVKMAEAKNVSARTKPSPGSSLAAPGAADIDIPVAPEVDPMGYQYIKSMAKLIAAWIAS